jgi:hypothetical protein
MNTQPNFTPATPEEIWAILRETAQLQKENERHFEKEQRSFEKERAKTEKMMKENALRFKEMEQTIGSWANNHGFFAEEYFISSFKKGRRNFFGENFERLLDRVKGIPQKGFEDEYDILLINGKSVGIVEIKFKAHLNDIPTVLRKAETFRVNFPEYKNHQIYLGLATMAFYHKLEQECIKKGIAVIKQIGDSVVINDKNLKIF